MQEYSFHPAFFIYILPYSSGKANNFTTGKLDKISKICKMNGINIIGIASDGDSAMVKFHKKKYRTF